MDLANAYRLLNKWVFVRMDGYGSGRRYKLERIAGNILHLRDEGYRKYSIDIRDIVRLSKYHF